MLTSQTTLSASDLPTGHNVTNFFGDCWSIHLTDDTDHLVSLIGTPEELADAAFRLCDAVQRVLAQRDAARTVEGSQP